MCTPFSLYLLRVRLYLAAIASILRSLQPPTPQNGLQMIIDAWRGAESADARLLDIDSYTFSSSVTPKPCHSHNDYMHRVPLFEALAAGCVSVEADIYLPLDNASKNTSELLVSHKRSALSSLRTLRSLYTEPLLTVLKAMNPSVANDTDLNGPFLSDSSTYLTLLLDFKELSPDALAQSLALLQSHLTPLRNAGFLTTYNNVTISIDQRPLTIVASGALPLDMIMDPTLNPHDDVFLDAPLNDLFPNGRDTDSPYNISNSAMASASLSTAIGNPGVLSGAFSESQKNKMGEQVAQAAQLGLKSRYWGTPAWPAGSMGYVWRELLQRGISVLNVDELGLFARWRWDEGKLSKWCWLLGSVVGGVCR